MPDTTTAALPPARTGFVGLGSMGAPMARRLVAAGIPLGITARIGSADRARRAVPEAQWHDSARSLAAASDVLIVMVPDLPQLEEVLEGEEGVLAAGSDLVLVVCSSVSASGLRELAGRHPRLRLVDAPVSGGTEGAEAGTLSIMVGGAEEDVARVLPVLSACGTAVRLGPLGAGEVAKACNQLVVAATMTAIAEAAVIAERSGLDLDTLLALLEGGYAGSRVLETKRAALVARDYTPTGVASFMDKDLRAAADEAEATGTSAPLLGTLRTVFRDLVDAGLGNEDLAVVHRFVAER
ncbi:MULTISPECIES: NAD(P)-dependent oxidoreductase [unclassified Rathayibacter]|uniref:NAD(P)-dependent oxidoreductase n=1 Tax=unclassified Rathayibacter TaxID=2609250 RepID=UPI000CE83240|nr:MULTISPECIES: NAD(P)-dependent oxidoreductase [unclassified Rathayibacter]PPF18896.1 3-hydroxyisobutyrate dehydrogenase [Rathayibacter sp. AY1A4]PPG80991.1 3-hydroxyisobutyrate dehydrogenase [Rathayibacter sp. AY1E5]PPH31550.1 3-hydroxyisobutyrate dehydrogenase [Rathayibacter sp. AY1C3]PPH65992.1 3-hydroxyisobutyrate dehydrogenase [Rathayibacter sp. AY1D7]PPI29057.1 3-hydroxyisobutyrate dehydrogenase [Rathayibacter sp. AY1B4]